MGGSSPRNNPMRVRAMQRVKCRTGGRSPLGVASACGGGPNGTGRGAPLDTRNGAIRSGVLVGGLFTPTGCPAASDAFDFLAAETGPYNLIQGNKVPQPVTARLSRGGLHDSRP